jgi:hypothetical protein
MISVDCPTLKRFQASLRAKMAASKRTEPEIVNKALKDVALRAMQFTEAADPTTIEAALRRDKIALKLATKKLAGRAGTVRVNSRGYTGRTKGGNLRKFSKRVSRAQIAAEARKIINRRKAGARAIRAGWIPGARTVGAGARGGARLTQGSAQRGTGRRATQSAPYGFIRNSLVTRSARGGRRMGVGQIRQAIAGLRAAVSFVASDVEKYVRQKTLARVIKSA